MSTDLLQQDALRKLLKLLIRLEFVERELKAELAAGEVDAEVDAEPISLDESLSQISRVISLSQEKWLLAKQLLEGLSKHLGCSEANILLDLLKPQKEQPSENVR